MRKFVFLILLICTACGFEQGVSPSRPPQGTAMAATPNVCRIGPNDGPMLAERGVGGTGMPLFNSALPAASAPASAPIGQDRGIGGTGAPALGAGAKSVAGNTGIVGEITGFASVCLNGVEVAYDPATQVSIDGRADTPDALRAGQVAAIVAAPDAVARDGLRAMTVSVRHEISGPVSAVDNHSLTVAGQGVILTANTRGMSSVMPGEWIAISGFRNKAGVLVATRIDPQEPGAVTVHGNIIKIVGGFGIGGLRLELPPDSHPIHNGEAVTVTGRLNDTELQVDSITPDLLYSDPQAYFGPTVKKLLIQSYVYTLGGSMFVAVGTSIYLAEGKLFYNPSGPSIFSLIVSPRGTLQEVGHLFGNLATGWGPMNGGAGGPPPP
jgi:hypothetical protein